MTKAERIVIECTVQMTKAAHLGSQLYDELEKIIGSNKKLLDLIVRYKKAGIDYYRAIDDIYMQGFTMDEAFELKNKINAQKVTAVGGELSA